MQRDRTINWPPDSNRDSIARDLDAIHFRFPKAKRAKLRAALRTIFEWAWPPDKPPDWKPGHVLQKFDKRLLNPPGKEMHKDTLLAWIDDLEAEGAIEVARPDGAPLHISLDWDNLFGVESEWRAARKNPPVENENSTGGVSMNWEKLASVEGIAALKASIDADEVSLRAKRRLFALLTAEAGTPGESQSGLSTTPRDTERIAVARDVAQSASSDSSTGGKPISTGGKPISTGGSSFMNDDFMKSEKTFMNHEIMNGLETPPVGFENSTGGVLTLARPAKARSGKRTTWWLDDPYYDITREHLQSPIHRARMFEMVIRKGVLHESEISAEQWNGMADYALLAGDPGSAFHGNIERLRRKRKATPSPVATAVRFNDLPESLDQASVEWCYAALCTDFSLKQEFVRIRQHKDPRKDPMMRAKLMSAFLRLREKLKKAAASGHPTAGSDREQ